MFFTFCHINSFCHILFCFTHFLLGLADNFFYIFIFLMKFYCFLSKLKSLTLNPLVGTDEFMPFPRAIVQSEHNSFRQNMTLFLFFILIIVTPTLHSLCSIGSNYLFSFNKLKQCFFFNLSLINNWLCHITVS